MILNDRSQAVESIYFVMFSWRTGILLGIGIKTGGFILGRREIMQLINYATRYP